MYPNRIHAVSVHHHWLFLLHPRRHWRGGSPIDNTSITAAITARLCQNKAFHIRDLVEKGRIIVHVVVIFLIGPLLTAQFPCVLGHFGRCVNAVDRIDHHRHPIVAVIVVAPETSAAKTVVATRCARKSSW
jgi:hypothetical protein